MHLRRYSTPWAVERDAQQGDHDGRDPYRFGAAPG